MTLDQLRAFANSTEGHIHKLALTREAARALIAEHELEVGKNLEPVFEINIRRNNGPLDAALTLKRFKRMAAEDGRAVL